ncbi:hypothetical protein VTL71DRAFT_15075 [Oculimacula yallundae]|uniref:Uncharacterized protein n=1 Tax=Oculimacula yallundae TaxID=86028 RepID=A0ABR4CFJ2_9HELO
MCAHDQIHLSIYPSHPCLRIATHVTENTYQKRSEDATRKKRRENVVFKFQQSFKNVPLETSVSFLVKK